MGMILTNHKVHNDILVRITDRFENWLSQIIQHMALQNASWQRFNRTPAGRHVTRRAWMRHGAMLELLSNNQLDRE